jgi:adenosine/AMP kinase
VIRKVPAARDAMLELGTGHAFLILLRNAVPINALPVARAVQEVCGIHRQAAAPADGASAWLFTCAGHSR